jgi:hypothetical protein
MSDEQENVDAGSENSGETTEATQVSSTDTTTDAVQTDTNVDNAGEAAEPKAGDACTCPDGRAGTLQTGDQEGQLVCLPNQG